MTHHISEHPIQNCFNVIIMIIQLSIEVGKQSSSMTTWAEQKTVYSVTKNIIINRLYSVNEDHKKGKKLNAIPGEHSNWFRMSQYNVSKH